MEDHFGVYALIVDAGRILLVRKTRGPYVGLLDLPGGSPEPGESWPETLQRELREELGVVGAISGRFEPFSLHVQESSSGAAIDFHHRGVVLELPRPARPVTAGRSADTDGAEWFDLGTGDRSRLSPVVRRVLELSD